MKLLQKLQGLPEERKKTILWVIVGLIAVALFIWWWNNFQARISGLQI
jgi:cytoskeletal protein RodZ